MVDFKKLSQNIKLRREAERFLELSDNCSQEFYEQLLNVIQSKLPFRPQHAFDEPFTNQQATMFENSLVPDRFHKYAGKQVRDVPDAYFDYLLATDPWIKDLRRYTKSEHYQNRDDRE